VVVCVVVVVVLLLVVVYVTCGVCVSMLLVVCVSGVSYRFAWPSHQLFGFYRLAIAHG